MFSLRRLRAITISRPTVAAVKPTVFAPACAVQASSIRRLATATDPWPNGKFDPPALVDDLTRDNLKGWSDVISDMHDQSRARPGTRDFRPQFFNPLQGKVKKPAGTAPTKEITWTAFPRNVKVTSGSDTERWQTADNSREVQDEYCEWNVTRNDQGKITKVSFTSEGPEYIQYLFSVQPQTVLDLYRKYISPKVQMRDLMNGDVYSPINQWNRDTTNGAMHLISPPNSLGAEVKLAADASLPRRRANGQYITDAQDLINCAQYGVSTRNSDPTIGAGVNAFARQGYMIALANPVALYMKGIDTSTFITPDGDPASKFWRVERGQTHKILRASFEVRPEDGKNYVVGDIMTGPDQLIQFGSQLADFITVFLTGMVADMNKANIKPRDSCERGGNDPDFGTRF